MNFEAHVFRSGNRFRIVVPTSDANPSASTVEFASGEFVEIDYMTRERFDHFRPYPRTSWPDVRKVLDEADALLKAAIDHDDRDEDRILAVVDAFIALPGNNLGGELHIALEDGNLDDDDLAYCSQSARSVGDGPGQRIAQLLKCVDVVTRVHVYEKRS